MEPESSLAYSQKPANEPYREPDESSSHPYTLRAILKLSPIFLSLSSDFLRYVFRLKLFAFPIWSLVWST
jgi:hypothetical protein